MVDGRASISIKTHFTILLDSHFSIYSSEGIVLFLLEVTFLAKCIRGTDRLIELSKNNKMKVGVYLIASITMWLSLFVGASSLILPAIILSITTFLYGGAVARNEDAAKSSVLSQEGIARSVISRV